MQVAPTEKSLELSKKTAAVCYGQNFFGRSLAYGKGGLYCKATRAHLRHARAALATAPQRRPKGSLSLTIINQNNFKFILLYT